MILYPQSATQQLEFDKVKELLKNYCQTQWAKLQTDNLRVHTNVQYIEVETNQSYEFKLLLDYSIHFPNHYFKNVQKELKLLSITGAMLYGDQFLEIKKLCENAFSIIRWFTEDKQLSYGYLYKIAADVYAEKKIVEWIDDIIDEEGNVKDSASKELAEIRIKLTRKRNEQRKVFDKILSYYQKQGYISEIEESISTGRRVIAVNAEYKRKVKGIFHGESQTGKTTFIEPEETIGLNNEVASLEFEEEKEVQKILRNLTALLQAYAPLLNQYLELAGKFDFIEAKAKLAKSMQATKPDISAKPIIQLHDAYHPLLLLYNQKAGKPTIPLQVKLDEEKRILIISGPNAGGKTVSMKTIGLIQLMFQSGLLVPVSNLSTLGVFKQLMLHIGDTQNLEFELSTYSSHLKHMKYFLEMSNGKTLFFIDEFGSGSDPKLGAAIAEVMLEELCKKHAKGVVTTHYLNLKIMAGSNKAIINGAMAFDEQKLEPKYKLIIGKPGSSYTFAIAQRIGIPKHLIQKAEKLAEKEHFVLDDLLNDTEQQLSQLEEKEKVLQKQIEENKQLKKQLDHLIRKEQHQQQVEILKQKNKVAEEKYDYLRTMERKLKQIVADWKNTDDKEKVIGDMKKLLFGSNQTQANAAATLNKKLNKKYQDLPDVLIEVGTLVRSKSNYQVGKVSSIKSKKAVVQIGMIPITYDLTDLIAVKKKETPLPSEAQ